MEIYLDMYQTITVAVLVLMLGKILKKKFGILERFCIPAPVIGGVVFAVFTCICYVTGIAEFSFDDILKEVCMVFFFTSVGFQANLKVLKSGGKALIIFLGLVIGLILSQNFLAVGLAKLLHISPLVGLCTRFNSDGRRSRYGRCIWPGAGGFWYYGCNNTLYGRCNIWSDYGQYHGRTGRQASD